MRFIYNPADPDSIVHCYIKDNSEKISELTKVIIELKYLSKDDTMVPIYETDRVKKDNQQLLKKEDYR